MPLQDSTIRFSHAFTVVGLNYFTIYVEPLPEAIAFYSIVFGSPGCADVRKNIYGWKMGSTWLTLLSSKIGPTPDTTVRNAEFSVQVAAPEEVDALHALLLQAGARPCMEPADTEMYERMRYCCVDDPFGTRIGVYCPRPS